MPSESNNKKTLRNAKMLQKNSQYKELRTSQHTLKLDQANSHVCIGGKVAKLQNIISLRDEMYVAYNTFNHQESLFDYPLPSSTLGINLVDDLSTTVDF